MKTAYHNSPVNQVGSWSNFTYLEHLFSNKFVPSLKKEGYKIDVIIGRVGNPLPFAIGLTNFYRLVLDFEMKFEDLEWDQCIALYLDVDYTISHGNVIAKLDVSVEMQHNYRITKAQREAIQELIAEYVVRFSRIWHMSVSTAEFNRVFETSFTKDQVQQIKRDANAYVEGTSSNVSSIKFENDFQLKRLVDAFKAISLKHNVTDVDTTTVVS